MIKINCLIFISCCILNILAVPSSVCRADFRWDDCGKRPKAVIYYWNKGSRCEIGMWKGCLPNPNMFADEYECINTCVFVERPATPTETEEPEEKSQLNATIAPFLSNEGAGYSTAGEGGDATDGNVVATIHHKIADQKVAESVASLHHKYKYIPELDTWLRLHIVPQTWECAFRQCQLEGGVLASPSSENLTNATIAMIKDHDVILHSVFIGNHAAISEGDQRHKSSDGRQDENKNCVTMLNGTIDNVSCNSNHSYFCRKENNSMVFNQGCTTTSVGYTYSPRTHSCYKFYSKAESWHEADRVCTAEEAHLAIINSDIEAEVLMEIFAKYPPKTIIGARYAKNCHVGYRLWDDGWRTIYGQNITEAGYDKWAEGQPNNLNQIQNIGAMKVGVGLNDLAETDLQPFFCESSPEYNPHYLPQILTTLLHKKTKK